MKSSPFFTGRAFRAFEFMPSGKCKARALPLPWLVSPVVSEGGGGASVNRRYRSPKGDHGGHLWEQGHCFSWGAGEASLRDMSSELEQQ